MILDRLRLPSPDQFWLHVFQKLLLETQNISRVYHIPALKKGMLKAVGTPQLCALHQHIFCTCHGKPGICIINLSMILIWLLHIKIRPVCIYYFIEYALSIHFILHLKAAFGLKLYFINFIK